MRPLKLPRFQDSCAILKMHARAARRDPCPDWEITSCTIHSQTCRNGELEKISFFSYVGKATRSFTSLSL